MSHADPLQLPNSLSHPGPCEDRCLTRMWKAHEGPHLYITKRGSLGSYLNPVTLYWSARSKAGEWVVMCMCVRVSILPLFLWCSAGLEIWCGIFFKLYLDGNKRTHGPLYINIISYYKTILYRSQHEYYGICIACTLYIHLYFFFISNIASYIKPWSQKGDVTILWYLHLSKFEYKCTYHNKFHTKIQVYFHSFHIIII